jgi:regulator of sigma E protease
MTVISAVLLFGFLIFIHELGHFIVAKSNGVRIMKFSLGFGPRLIGRQIGETEYVISAIPLGGYVKMLGEDSEEDGSEPADDARSYRNQSVLKRTAIVFSGPLFNLLTAVVIYFLIFLIGVPTPLPVVGEVLPDSPAARSSLAKGDRIVEIGGTPVSHWTDMTKIIYESPGKPLSIKVRRGNTLQTISVTPERKTVKDLFGEEGVIGLIGVKPADETTTVKEDLPHAAASAISRTWEISVLTVVSIVKLIQRIIPADTIGGPILIFQLAEKQASAGALSFFNFAAVISINLAVLNLLPIPVLDGGHILFLLIEKIRRKPLSDKAIMLSQRIGLALIVTLMALALYNDIFRLIDGKPLP